MLFRSDSRNARAAYFCAAPIFLSNAAGLLEPISVRSGGRLGGAAGADSGVTPGSARTMVIRVIGVPAGISYVFVVGELVTKGYVMPGKPIGPMQRLVNDTGRTRTLAVEGSSVCH